jgi:hypothetical protein
VRNAVLQIPDHRTNAEQRKVLRIAVRQLERADLYLGAVCALELSDEDAVLAIDGLRDDLEDLRRHLVDVRARLVE